MKTTTKAKIGLATCALAALVNFWNLSTARADVLSSGGKSQIAADYDSYCSPNQIPYGCQSPACPPWWMIASYNACVTNLYNPPNAVYQAPNLSYGGNPVYQPGQSYP